MIHKFSLSLSFFIQFSAKYQNKPSSASHSSHLLMTSYTHFFSLLLSCASADDRRRCGYFSLNSFFFLDVQDVNLEDNVRPQLLLPRCCVEEKFRK